LTIGGHTPPGSTTSSVLFHLRHGPGGSKRCIPESIFLDAVDFLEHYTLIMEHADIGLEISVEEKCQRISAAAAKVHASLTRN